MIVPSSAARGLCGEVLRGLDDPGRALGREGAVQAGALPDPRVPAQLRGGEAQDPAERQFHHGAAVGHVLAIGHARGAVRVPVAAASLLRLNKPRNGPVWDSGLFRTSIRSMCKGFRLGEKSAAIF